MEYRYFTPEEVSNSKKLNRFLIFLSILPVIFGIILGISSIGEFSTKSAPITDYTYKNLQAYKYYTIDELVVVGDCGYLDYIAFFTDGNGQRVYVLLNSYSLDDETERKCLAAKRDDFKIGDVVLKGHFSFSSYFFDSDKDDLDKAYGNVASTYPGIRLYHSVTYTSEEGFEKAVESGRSSGIAVLSTAATILVFSLMIVAYNVRQRKHLDQYLEEYYRTAPPPPQNQYY